MTDRKSAIRRANEPHRSLTIPGAMLDTIIRHLAGVLPHEGVGLIAVAREVETWRATAFIPGTNVDHSSTRYTMEPAEVVAGLRMIDANGWQLGAIVHSHVATPPTPSATDLREAYYPDALMLIVGFEAGQAELRVWRLEVGDGVAMPVEVRLVVEPETRTVSNGRDNTGPAVFSQESQACDS